MIKFKLKEYFIQDIGNILEDVSGEGIINISENIEFISKVKSWEKYSWSLEIINKQIENFLNKEGYILIYSNTFYGLKNSMILGLIWRYLTQENNKKYLFQNREFRETNPKTFHSIDNLWHYRSNIIEKKSWDIQKRLSLKINPILKYINENTGIPVPKIYFYFNDIKVEIKDLKEEKGYDRGPDLKLFL